jgi:hypothetical protein
MKNRNVSANIVHPFNAVPAPGKKNYAAPAPQIKKKQVQICGSVSGKKNDAHHGSAIKYFLHTSCKLWCG